MSGFDPVMLGDFHFLRPLWLLAIPGLVGLVWLLRRPGGSLQAWRRVCDEHLLAHLTSGQLRKGSRAALWALTIAWVIASVALAGPVWQKRALPLFKTIDSRVILLDLSRSMLASDLSPNRLEQARYKISDLLDRSKEGQVALVAYAGESFVVSPLTDDANTVKAMLGALDPSIMPVQGSELDEAMDLAGQLLERGNQGQGEILIFTDSVGLGGFDAAQALADRGYRVSVLGVGTPEGAPIPERQGGFFKAADGSIVVPRLDESALQRLAEIGGGHYVRLTNDDSDLEYVMRQQAESPDRAESTDQESQQWREEGPWLVLLLLPLGALAFRKGWLAMVAVVAVLPIEPANALTWADLWSRPDQQARRALDDGRPAEAVGKAEDPRLRGEALYRNGDFRSAESAFAQGSSADAHYNRGNALARQQRLEEAIAAYDEALAIQPDMEDALYNKQLLEQLLQQQQEQQQEQQQQDSESSEDQQQQDSQQQQGEGEQQEQEQQQQEQQQGEAEQGEQEQQPADMDDELSPEERQAVEQWLRRIPDDPGGLLRRKFLLEYQRRGTPPPASDEDW